tara:strand:- start:140 stop:1117 length:978 start_codon:yes stop_codon:yes gene_type:complete
MPTEEQKMVDIDTSGPGAEINVEEKKDESVVNTEAPKQEEVVETKQEEVKEEVKEELSEGSEPEVKKDEEKLEDYSKGVQSRIAKLTRKMREAERREKAALDYARAVESKRKTLDSKFGQVNKDYVSQFEKRVKDGMESAQKELSSAIESGDATAQVNAQKRIAALSIDEARLNVMKETAPAEEKPVKLEDEVNLPRETPSELPNPDPRAETWAAKNTWFGQDRPMTFTAFEIHKDLVEKEGFDPKSDEYYAEVDKRIRLEFPNKFDIKDSNTSARPTQTVASARRVVRPGTQTVKLTSSQVAIAKKLGVPLEEYAKQLKITKEV